jgi:hypothetical protein
MNGDPGGESHSTSPQSSDTQSPKFPKREKWPCCNLTCLALYPGQSGNMGTFSLKRNYTQITTLALLLLILLLPLLILLFPFPILNSSPQFPAPLPHHVTPTRACAAN